MHLVNGSISFQTSGTTFTTSTIIYSPKAFGTVIKQNNTQLQILLGHLVLPYLTQLPPHSFKTMSSVIVGCIEHSITYSIWVGEGVG